MKEMYSRYGWRKGKYTNRDFLHIVNDVTGKDFTEFFKKYVYGKNILQPLQEYFDDDDKDNLLNIDELRFGTDPKDVDTDGDGYCDFYELINGMDPKVPEKKILDESVVQSTRRVIPGFEPVFTLSILIGLGFLHRRVGRK